MSHVGNTSPEAAKAAPQAEKNKLTHKLSLGKVRMSTNACCSRDHAGFFVRNPVNAPQVIRNEFWTYENEFRASGNDFWQFRNEFLAFGKDFMLPGYEF